MQTLSQLRSELKILADPEKAVNLGRFFKTGKGEYGEGDIFLGITVPVLRKLAAKYSSLDLRAIGELIKSKFHEERMVALFILVNKYKRTNHKQIIYNFYMKNTKYINNWDLVDLSAHEIAGRHLFSLINSSCLKIRAGKDFVNSAEMVLKTLGKSKNIWERRIAVLATFRFIKENRFEDSLKLAEMLLADKHDLIHKAVGWMLREIGKRDLKTETKFLDRHYKIMPRTMLRYAIERFPKEKRAFYLGKLLP